MNKINSIITLLRVQQWYKNIIIFFGIVFALELVSPANIFVSILGFVALCLITSAGYIRNDILDLQQDKIHPEKCKRPLPSGQITLKKDNTVYIMTKQYYTWEEVADHDSEESMWIVANDKVYDVTEEDGKIYLNL